MKESIESQFIDAKASNNRPNKGNTSTNEGAMAQEQENRTVVDRKTNPSNKSNQNDRNAYTLGKTSRPGKRQ